MISILICAIIGWYCAYLAVEYDVPDFHWLILMILVSILLII